MKRPLFIAAALVLSGMVCGIKESGLTMKAAAIILTAVLLVFIMSGYFERDNPLNFIRSNDKDYYKSQGDQRITQLQADYQKQSKQQQLVKCGQYGNKELPSTKFRYRLCLAAIALAIFLLGFARGAVQSHIYNTSECVEFYEYYKPTNPGLFDYSLYLKSLGISSREQYEAYRDSSGTDTAPVMCMLNAVKEHCTDRKSVV